ncbi:MAG: hypothetical protein FWC95_04340 [Defluviitaleaceae bacterium]|nr:hypothetical protein [Defluviitaleaceae bacterium]
MSKKLLEQAKENLSGQLYEDFLDFYNFLKSENVTFAQGYKCYKFKYKGEDVGKVSTFATHVECRVSLSFKSGSDKYVTGQTAELADIFMKSLSHKCTNCREGRTGCGKQLGMTINVAGESHKNICVQAFGDFLSFAFSSIDGYMRTMMRTTPKTLPAINNDSPVTIETVKNLILIKKAYITES